MGTSRQKLIAVSTQEGKVLEDRKRHYEQHTGDTGDWGHFLDVITLLGLAAADIYRLTRCVGTKGDYVEVKCPYCDGDIFLAIPLATRKAILLNCFYCDEEMVVVLDQKSKT